MQQVRLPAVTTLRRLLRAVTGVAERMLRSCDGMEGPEILVLPIQLPVHAHATGHGWFGCVR
jgi:hypothetical protein